ncbi:hypothetical protein COJ96_05735 [Bacillus sp. AFS073361]|uniref:hypothetical protein n=1 Tax=Bacillus sp. AFS073361 TaxID=2033511 RepID=UPI000BF93F30|nr:hypothetical protein [Bacillus sp. AFS073361]PFP30214.1 hypothetical protein COJ96_05735 [Bacillus sp. AFS073361]
MREPWEYEFDRWKTTPPAEPASVRLCAHCEGDLFEGGEYVKDLVEGEWYCDTDCYFEKMRDNTTLAILEAERDEE